VSPAGTASPFLLEARGVRVLVRVSPKSARARVLGLGERPDGRADLIAFLAKEWRVPKRRLALLSGASDRRKVVLVEGEAAALLERLERWLAEALATSPP
jgi:uncharacterized protein YggU (UPF0235/DUF167 family)